MGEKDEGSTCKNFSRAVMRSSRLLTKCWLGKVPMDREFREKCNGRTETRMWQERDRTMCVTVEKRREIINGSVAVFSDK